MYVDITKKSVVTAVEWFYGYGGNAIGLRRAIPGLREVAKCERDAFVVANMVSKMEKGLMDPVPVWTDATTFPTEPFGYQQLDLFIASYPCQGFSHAGKRLGADDHRHLWPHCRKFIGSVRPRFVWLENVEGHVSLGLSTVLADLEEDGYKSSWGIFSASEVGAPHQRKRVFILAHDMRRAEQELSGGGELRGGSASESRSSVRFGTGSGNIGGDHAKRDKGQITPILPEDVAQQQQQGLEGHAGDEHCQGGEPGGAGGPTAEGGVCGEGSVDDTAGLRSRKSADGGPESSGIDSPGGQGVWPSRPGQPQFRWEPPRVVNSESRRIARGQESVGESGSSGAGEGVVENPLVERVQRGTGGPTGNDGCGSDSKITVPGGGCKDRGADRGQTESPMGGNADGPADGLDLSRHSGLSDLELAEIREWMVKGTNRTDELRMLGNGVVPQTAEKAFRVLYAELTGK